MVLGHPCEDAPLFERENSMKVTAVFTETRTWTACIDIPDDMLENRDEDDVVRNLVLNKEFDDEYLTPGISNAWAELDYDIDFDEVYCDTDDEIEADEVVKYLKGE